MNTTPIKTAGLLSWVAALTSSLAGCNLSDIQEAPVTEVTSSTEAFEFDESRIEIGAAYHFEITNRDRSNSKRVTLYVADRQRIEAFKVYQGESVTNLVKAEMDWKTFSIARIEQTNIKADLSREVTIEMNATDDDGYEWDGRAIPVGHFPVTNHGYDFSDLNFMMRHKKDPTADVEIGVVSPILYLGVLGPSAKFAYTGKMRMAYVGEEDYKGRIVYRYDLSGQGIGDHPGQALFAKEGGHLVYMELEMNYHPDFDYFRYELLGLDAMSSDERAGFINNATIDALAGERP